MRNFSDVFSRLIDSFLINERYETRTSFLIGNRYGWLVLPADKTVSLHVSVRLIASKTEQTMFPFNEKIQEKFKKKLAKQICTKNTRFEIMTTICFRSFLFFLIKINKYEKLHRSKWKDVNGNPRYISLLWTNAE